VPAVAEKLLNHRPADRLIETYDRHTYADEQRQAMELWAGRVRDIVSPPLDNVTSIERRAHPTRQHSIATAPRRETW